MTEAQIFMQSLVNSLMPAIDTKLNQFEQRIIKNYFKHLKVTNDHLAQNAVEGINVKDSTLYLKKFVDLQADFATFFAVETHALVADWIKSGQLDVNKVSIFTGSDLRFVINGDGIYGYYSPSAGTISEDTYVHFGKDGFECVKDGVQLAILGWNSLKFFEVVNGQAYESLIADSTGKLYLKRKLTVGVDPYDGLVMDGVTKSLYSSKYSSGAMGSGFYIDGNRAEFGNIRARGTLTATVFEHDKLSSVGGSLYVSPSLISSVVSPITTVTIDTVNYYSISLEFAFTGENHYAAGMEWSTSDLVSVQGIIELTDAIYEVRDFRCKITSFTETGCVLQSVDPIASIIAYDEDTGAPYEAGTISLSGGQIESNSAFIYIGSLGTNGEILRRGILISASEDNSPYIDIYDSTESDTMPKARLGNLSGIVDESMPVAPSGYGIYSINAFLRGIIVADEGIIGGMHTDAHTMHSTDGTVGIGDGTASSPVGDWVFWAGNLVAGSAPCRIDKNGHIYFGTSAGDHISYDGTDVNIKAKNVEIKATGNLTVDANGRAIISGGASLELESTGSLVAKSGSDMEFQSGASETFKAGSDITLEAGAKLYASAEDIVVAADKTLAVYAGEQVTIGVSNIAIGGENLILRTWDWLSPPWSFQIASDGSYGFGMYGRPKEILYVSGGTSTQSLVYQSSLPATPGIQYTFTAAYFSRSATSGLCRIAQKDVNGTYLSTHPISVDTKTVTFTANASVSYFSVEIIAPAGVGVYVGKVKLAIGNKADGWSPAPSDPSNGVSTSYVQIYNDSLRMVTGGTMSIEGAAVNMATDLLSIQNADKSKLLLELASAYMRLGADVLYCPNIIGNVLNTFDGATVPWVGSIGSSINNIGKWLLNTCVLTVPSGTYNGDIVIPGIKGANLTMNLQSGVRIFGKIVVYGFDDLLINVASVDTAYITPNTSGGGVLEINTCSRVRITNLNVSGYASRTSAATGSDYGVHIRSSSVTLTGCSIDRTGVAAIYATENSMITVLNCFGGIIGGNDPATVANLGYGVRPSNGCHAAIIGKTFASVSGDEAYFSTIVQGSPTVTGSTGTTPPAPSTRTYAVSEGYEKKTESDENSSVTWNVGKPRQGSWRENTGFIGPLLPGESYYVYYNGFGIFILAGSANIVSDRPSGKTITAAAFKLKRDASTGTSSTVTCTLYQHGLSSISNGVPSSILFAQAADPVTLSPNQEVIITLNASAISNLNNGVCKGFGFRNIGGYGRYEITGELTVTYS